MYNFTLFSYDYQKSNHKSCAETSEWHNDKPERWWQNLADLKMVNRLPIKQCPFSEKYLRDTKNMEEDFNSETEQNMLTQWINNFLLLLYRIFNVEVKK